MGKDRCSVQTEAKLSLHNKNSITSTSSNQVRSAVKQLDLIDQKKLKLALPYLTTQLQNMDSFNETMLQIYDKILIQKTKKTTILRAYPNKRSLMQPSYDTIHNPIVLYETIADILTMYQREYLEYYIKEEKIINN